ncbi:kinase-like protein, partial [Rhizodiscina lignyota]
VYEYLGRAYKTNTNQRAYDLQMSADDCAARPAGRVMKIMGDGSGPACVGMLMMRLEPFDVTKVRAEEKDHFKKEMLRLVVKLHKEYGIVHGNIKPENFLRCADGTLRLCDFDCARFSNGDVDGWEVGSQEYMSPNRTLSIPTTDDDIYALGLSIFSLYTGKAGDFFPGEDVEEVRKAKRTVDVMQISCPETRLTVKMCLRQGGVV